MTKTLADLLTNIKGYSVYGDSAIQVTGVASDSRLVEAGSVFVAIPGATVDGHDFIAQAVEKGAKVIVGEKELAVPSVTYVRVQDSAAALGAIASNWYGNPSEKLKVIGVTGTKGKTTTVHLIYHILSNLGKKVGIVSSILAKIGESEINTGFHVTNPDVITLNKFLSEMLMAGCEYAIVEVSSHGIAQKRIAGISFEIGVLTNIAPEHLDYHKTFKEYKRIKMSFVNSSKHKVIAPNETSINILPGEFNNLNVEAAIKAVEQLGIDKQEALVTLKSFKLPEGRLSEIKNDKGFRIFVDFAHTPNSLEAVLKHLRTLTKGRLISVFGCASERDIKKRRKMGKISGQLADFSVFTTEDSRNENVTNIFRLMKKDAKNYICINERSEAIAYALSQAKKGDVVGFFGKGHEKSMAFGGFEHPWSDSEIINDFLSRDTDLSAIILAAGKGTRMKSSLPKILHEICGRPMIAYTLQNLRKSGMGEIITVVSFKKNLVIPKIQGAVKIAIQKNPKGGTADAAKTGFSMVNKLSKIIVVINGDDSAFYTPKTIKEIIKIHKNRERKLTFVSLIKENPTGLGRIIRGADGLITKIVEEKDATDEEKRIKEVNDGLYVFDRAWFTENIKHIKKGPQGEYYINDLVKMAIDQGDRMATYTLPNDDEWQGINTPEQLEIARQKMAKKISL